MISTKLFRYLCLLMAASFILAACGPTPASGVYVWIDVPLDGLSFSDLQPINVEGHASGADGIARVEVYVDGELWTAVDDPRAEGSLAKFQTEWLPPGFGTYVIQAIAYAPDGSASQYDEARVSFVVAQEAEEISEEPVITVTPGEQEAVPAVLFWAEPENITAGACTTLHWQAENVSSLIFGGIEQPLEGSYQDCLCANQIYTLTVNHLDGSEEKVKLNITVDGTCQDLDPPPAPVQAVPANGLSLACKSSQNLAWIPATDDSGIREYRVQAQRHAGDNNWNEVPGSVFSGIADKQSNLSVECGWTYRWRVQAVDGAGNVGPWSGWWSFVIILE